MCDIEVKCTVDMNSLIAAACMYRYILTRYVSYISDMHCFLPFIAGCCMYALISIAGCCMYALIIYYMYIHIFLWRVYIHLTKRSKSDAHSSHRKRTVRFFVFSRICSSPMILSSRDITKWNCSRDTDTHLSLFSFAKIDVAFITS